MNTIEIDQERRISNVFTVLWAEVVDLTADRLAWMASLDPSSEERNEDVLEDTRVATALVYQVAARYLERERTRLLSLSAEALDEEFQVVIGETYEERKQRRLADLVATVLSPATDLD